MSLAFLLCVERGPLEQQSLLCVESLRTFGGALAESPVCAFAPRVGNEPELATVRALARLGADFVAENLNLELRDLPHTNKVFVAEWAEAQLDAEVLAFIDSDTVFFREPDELAGDGWDAAARPVGAVNQGSTGEGHKNEPVWQAIYEELGVTERPFVETVTNRMRIRAFFNAGLVAWRRPTGIGAEWCDATLRLLDTKAGATAPRRRQIDQLALGGVLAKHWDRVFVLPASYNYPLPKRIKLPAEMQALDLPDMTLVHGHRWLHYPGLLEEVHPPLDSSTDAYRWLDERLPLQPTIEGPFRFPKDEG